MGLRGFDFIHTETGVHELFVETSDLEPGMIVVCDAISPNDQQLPSQESQAAATLAETTIRQELIKCDQIDEEAIQRSFERANQRVAELYDEEHPVAVSGVALVLQKGQEQEPAHSLLVGGVGDLRVWRIDAEQACLVFADPQVPEIHQTLSAEERSLALHNAMGNGEHLRVHLRRVVQNPFQRYVIASYGIHAQSNEDEVQKMGLHPHDPMQGVSAKVRSKGQKGHQLRVFTATYETAAGREEPEEVRAVPFEQRSNDRASNRKPLIALTGVTCALIAGAALLGVGDSTSDESTIATKSTHATGELAVLRERILVLSQERADLAQRAATLETNLRNAQTKPSNDRRVEELKANWQRASDEQQSIIARLQQELHEARTQEDTGERIAITELNEELARTQAQIAGLETEQDHAAEQLVALQDENRQLKEALQTVDGQTSSEDVIELTETLAQLQQQYVQEQVRALALEEKLEQTSSRKGVRKMRASLKALKSQVKELASENERLIELVVHAEQDKEKALQSVQEEAVARIESAERELASLLEEQREDNIEALTATRRELTELANALEEVKGDNAMLQASLSQAEQIAQEKEIALAQFQERLNEVRAQESANIHTVDELELALSREREASATNERELAAKTSRLRELEMMQRTITAKLEQMQRERSALLMDKASLMEKVTALTEFQEMYHEERSMRVANERSTATRNVRPSVSDTVRYHLVESGDTLSGLSLKYYGTSRRWQDILEANELKDAKQVRIGSKLLIP